MATISEARLRACKLWPYGSHAVLSLTPVESRNVASACVDQHWRLYYNPEGMAALTADEGAALILHELDHLLLRHHARAAHIAEAGDAAAWHRWNCAADLAINDMLLREGVTVPGTELFPERQGFERGLSAEGYYRILEQREQEQEPEQEEQGDGDNDGGVSDGKGEDSADVPEASPEPNGEGSDDSASDGPDGEDGSRESAVSGNGGVADIATDGCPAGDEQPAPQPGNGEGGSCADGQQRPWELPAPDECDTPGLKPHEADMLRRQVAERILEKSKGDQAGGGMLDWAREIIEPRIDPRSKLLIHVRSAVEQITGLGEYTYRRPNRRSPSAHCPLPASMAPVPRITVIVDTSGSMDQRDLGTALGLIGKVLKTLPNRDGIRVLCGDAELQTAANVFDPKTIVLAGGGGTDMACLIVEAAKEKSAPQLVIVATDGETGWPETATKMPVVACLTRKPTYCEPPPAWIKRLDLF